SVEGAVQTVLRSAASVASAAGSIMGATLVASWAAILPSTLRHARERLVPARFQFASHQPIGRVGGIVLPEGPIRCIARGLEITLQCFTHLVPPLAGFPLSGNGCRNGAGADHGEKRFLNGVIDPQAAKGDATRLTIVHPAAAAAVAWDVVLCARIAEGQLAPAAAGAEQ